MAFSFGTPQTTSGFSIPSTTALVAGAGDAKLANKPAATLGGGFSFGTPPTSTPKTQSNLMFGGAGTPQSSAINFGAPSTTSAPPSFTFATPTTSAAVPALNLTTPSTSAGAPSLNFGIGTSFGTPTTVTTTATSTPLQFNLSGTSISTATTTTATSSLSSFTPVFGTPTATSTAAATVTSSALKLTATTTSISSLSTSGTGITSAPSSLSTTQLTTATSSAASLSSTSSLTYAQLEDSINKWTIDLEEQGKFFINQAKQLNAWDSLLISNSDKIRSLNETIERVKQQQKQLDQELDFVMAQQNELEELSAPLEKQLADIPVKDQNRFQMYQLSEIIDSQLKQMSEDLKEIVEHLNESNKSEDISDPVIQVSRILNAHMNSLQWVDRNTSQICSHLEQISKMHEVHKQNHLNL